MTNPAQQNPNREQRPRTADPAVDAFTSVLSNLLATPGWRIYNVVGFVKQGSADVRGFCVRLRLFACHGVYVWTSPELWMSAC